MSRLLKANTVKSRVHSLYRQGQTYLQLLPSMPEPVRKAPPPFPELLLRRRQNLKTSRPTVANVPSRKFGDRSGQLCADRTNGSVYRIGSDAGDGFTCPQDFLLVRLTDLVRRRQLRPRA